MGLFGSAFKALGSGAKKLADAAYKQAKSGVEGLVQGLKEGKIDPISLSIAVGKSQLNALGQNLGGGGGQEVSPGDLDISGIDPALLAQLNLTGTPGIIGGSPLFPSGLTLTGGGQTGNNNLLLIAVVGGIALVAIILLTSK